MERKANTYLLRDDALLMLTCRNPVISPNEGGRISHSAVSETTGPLVASSWRERALHIAKSTLLNPQGTSIPPFARSETSLNDIIPAPQSGKARSPMCHKIVSSDRQNHRFNLLAHSASGLTIARRCINNRNAACRCRTPASWPLDNRKRSSWLAAVFWCGGAARKGRTSRASSTRISITHLVHAVDGLGADCKLSYRRSDN
jgi:hypothetical protein